MAKRKTSQAATIDGTMAFSELSSTDPGATRNFLEKVFAWRFQSVKFPLGEYLSFEAPGGGRGGIRPVQAREIPGSMNYVRVADLAAASREIQRARGAIVLPRDDLPGTRTSSWLRMLRRPIRAAGHAAPP